ncbi:hypothetical protein Nepgr_031868 [Nepenthes gracilis]|uniref:Uncharacterized protein n=1 Tax=Nepenthes gracilis TaxID=150966 RepID=A0AAD3TI99_NEPGR|nr:hypothetical protein Nepgr_031868 [Nepenthes gracilis]
MGRRIPLPVGDHGLLRWLRRPPGRWRRRIHRRVLGGATAKGRPRRLPAKQPAAGAGRCRNSLDGLVGIQRRRPFCGERGLVGGRAEHPRLRCHQPPGLDLLGCRLLQEALCYRRHPRHDHWLGLHNPWRRHRSSMGGISDGRSFGHGAVVHHDGAGQKDSVSSEHRRHSRRLSHARRRRDSRRSAYRTLRSSRPFQLVLAEPQRQGSLLWRWRPIPEAVGRCGFHYRVECRFHIHHSSRNQTRPASKNVR